MFNFPSNLCNIRATRFAVRSANQQKQENWRYQNSVLISEKHTG